jgi:hypothetical protein
LVHTYFLYIFRNYIEDFVFDNKPEKEETMKIEQDFVDSDPEKKAWIPISSTSSDKEDTSHDEKKVPVPRPST